MPTRSLYRIFFALAISLLSAGCTTSQPKADGPPRCDSKDVQKVLTYCVSPAAANYAKENVPRDEEGHPVLVYMNVSILAFPFIETTNLKFTADFFLNLRWYDLRIDFK